MRPSAAAFLPLTLTVINGVPADRAETHGLEAAARRAEHLAWDTWQALLGDCDRLRRTEFTTGLRRLSLAVGVFTGDDWSSGICSGHRDRIARYQCWLEEALADGNGAEFAEAFARYDDALARTVLSSAVSSPVSTGVSSTVCGAVTSAGSGGAPRRPAAVTVRPSGTMAGWARQARAATTRAVSPLRWATSRHATSSSRWSRHSRSAG
jgi:hypothetical protein